MRATGYHARSQTGVKVFGGILGMSRYMDLNDAAAELTESLDVIVTPSGRVSYAKDGKSVDLYLSVDPSFTEKGKAALMAHRIARLRRNQTQQDQEDLRQRELDDAVSALGTEDAIALLKDAALRRK